MTIEELTFTAFLAGRERGREESAVEIERLRKAVKLAIELHLECLVDLEEYGLTCSADIYPFYDAALQPEEDDQ